MQICRKHRFPFHLRSVHVGHLLWRLSHRLGGIAKKPVFFSVYRGHVRGISVSRWAKKLFDRGDTEKSGGGRHSSALCDCGMNVSVCVSRVVPRKENSCPVSRVMVLRVSTSSCLRVIPKVMVERVWSMTARNRSSSKSPTSLLLQPFLFGVQFRLVANQGRCRAVSQ